MTCIIPLKVKWKISISYAKDTVNDEKAKEKQKKSQLAPVPFSDHNEKILLKVECQDEIRIVTAFKMLLNNKS